MSCIESAKNNSLYENKKIISNEIIYKIIICINFSYLANLTKRSKNHCLIW